MTRVVDIVPMQAIVEEPFFSRMDEGHWVDVITQGREARAKGETSGWVAVKVYDAEGDYTFMTIPFKLEPVT